MPLFTVSISMLAIFAIPAFLASVVTVTILPTTVFAMSVLAVAAVIRSTSVLRIHVFFIIEKRLSPVSRPLGGRPTDAFSAIVRKPSVDFGSSNAIIVVSRPLVASRRHGASEQGEGCETKRK